MPIFSYKCPTCGTLKRTIQALPVHCDVQMVKLLEAPSAKFMEPRDKKRGKSVLKDQDKILLERAKEDSRKNDYAEFIHDNGTEVSKVHGWIGEDGRVKKKIDQT